MQGARVQSLVKELDPICHNKTQHSQMNNLGASQVALVVNVVACAQVGKEFPDLRQD